MISDNFVLQMSTEKTQQCLKKCQCLPFSPHQGHTQVFSMPWPQWQLKRRKTKKQRIVEIRIVGKEKK